jgi:hypothetical protein
MAPKTRKLVFWLSSAVVLVVAVLLFARPDPFPRPDRGPFKNPPPADPVTEPPAKEVTPPQIDVVIERFVVPSQVKPGEPMELTIVLTNRSAGSQIAGTANVVVRATIQSPTKATNIGISEMQFRRLEPGVPQTKTLHGRAPHEAGMWKVKATVEAKDYVDNINNAQEVLLTVH